MNGWTVFRFVSESGYPRLDPAQLLGCLAGLRSVLGDKRWHYRWAADVSNKSRDGVRVEVDFDSKGRLRIERELEKRIPPSDQVVAEPMNPATDLDPIQTEVELDSFLTLLWKYSEFMTDVKARNPRLRERGIRNMTSGALLMFVTGDRRHMERAMAAGGASSVPAVSLGRVLTIIQGSPSPYRLPPANHAESVAAARIHHLMGCSLSSNFYPLPRN